MNVLATPPNRLRTLLFLFAGTVIVGGILAYSAPQYLKGSLLSSSAIEFALKQRADTDHDSILTAREIRRELTKIIRDVALQKPEADINGDGVTNNLDVKAAVSGFRALLLAICGNGTMNAGERCDDGNASNNDGCSSVCTVESGFTCNTAEPNICTVLPVCGDGIREGFESCDDGNTTNADGCNQFCNIEPGFTCDGQPSSCHLLCGDNICDARNEFFTCRTDCTENTYSIGIGGDDFPSWRESGVISPRPECQSPFTPNCVSKIVVRSYGYLAHIYADSNPAPEVWGKFKGIRKFITTGKGTIVSQNGIDRTWGYSVYYPEGPQQYSRAVSEWDYINGTYAPPKITTLDELSINFTIVPPESASRLQINPITVAGQGTPQEHLIISGTVAPDPSGQDVALRIPYSTHVIYRTPSGSFSFSVWKREEDKVGPDDISLPYDLQVDPCPVSLWLALGNLSYASYLPEQVYAYKKACLSQ